jgi:peptidoglycan/LPS O-acetylase OafA/YrhL
MRVGPAPFDDVRHFASPEWSQRADSIFRSRRSTLVPYDMNSAPPASRSTNLDALRAIAILMVLGRHCHLSTWWHQIGWAGVDLFFVLSGFLVSGLLFSAFLTTGQIDLSRFYVRRGLKIWPSFYLLIASGLIIDAVLPGHSISTKGLLSYLFFLQNYLGLDPAYGHTWSLAVEEHFYLALPLLLLAIRGDRNRPFASMPWVFGAVAVLACAARFKAGWEIDGSGDVNLMSAYMFRTHLRLDALLFGALLSYYKHYRPAIFQRIASCRGGWLLLAVAVVLLSTVPLESRHMHTWGLTVIYLASGFVVARAVSKDAPVRGRVLVQPISGLLARIGIYSYSIYVWHVFVRQRLMAHLHIASPALDALCFIAVSILFGVAAGKIVEIPVLHFRDRMFPGISDRTRAKSFQAAA